MSESTNPNATSPKTGNLGITVGTWLYVLHSYGHAFSDAAITDACAAITSASPDDADPAGMALVELVNAGLNGASTAAEIRTWLAGLLGTQHVGSVTGDDRAARTQQMRTYQFRSNLPFITEIVDRFPDGTIGTHWVMVERVTDAVTCMDPYPWDDIDEEYTLPLVEFMVRWELAGGESILFQA
ncbi:MAG: hypothetical protein CL927_03410 [Deltaproteobacteria bacterium]|nr:hypothetical protein [Deltaproteobacteria bacterium]HCH63796.1 hypothetical protein [Deltaproteobacteria bacterium]